VIKLDDALDVLPKSLDSCCDNWREMVEEVVSLEETGSLGEKIAVTVGESVG
jgi:hypothetical protein